jgi:hypothetical protein
VAARLFKLETMREAMTPSIAMNSLAH